MDPRIIEYYKVCSIQSQNGLIIDEKVIDFLTNNEKKQLYLKPVDHAYVIRENVIGAGKKHNPKKNYKILII